MKALVYLGPRRMELQDLPVPDPGPAEARVRVATAAICGSDLHGFREASPRRIPPLVMGHEVVGRVEAVGAGVDEALEGERVVVMPVVSCGQCARCREGQANLCPRRRLMGMNFPGGFAETYTIGAGQLLPMPPGLSDETGSLVEPFANSLHSVDRSVREGDDVLVIGAGPIGLLAVRASVLAGAARTFVVDKLEDRLQLGKEQGGVPLPAEGAADAVEGATGGDGVDVVIDAVGVPSTWELGLGSVRWGGRLDVIGLGSVEGPISYHAVVSKGVTIVGSYACVRHDFDRALELLSDGSADVGSWITQMPLAEGQAAFEALVDGGRFTKVVLVP
ncbi:MAG: alcohol dehydrogenase catalytic domain-containing protein [Actinomycetota bacterium]|nr:alcohol dehydrogenase catalytic domain-containing protein [Actinomycetota bacterium]